MNIKHQASSIKHQASSRCCYLLTGKLSVLILIFNLVQICGLKSQTASFLTNGKYRVQNPFGTADFGTTNITTSSFIYDFITGTFIPGGYTMISPGPFPFYEISTDKYGFAFDKNIISRLGTFSTLNTELRFGFVTNSSPTLINPAILVTKSNGKVGIGFPTSVSIKAKLDVTNNVSSINTFKTNSVFTTEYQVANLFNVNTNGTKALVVNNTVSNKFIFIVRGNGATQIGEKMATNKHTDAMLSVYGKVVARSFYVTIDPALWADYVFEPNYKLKSLTEVEQFYKKHKHLPDVPSATEISNADLNLAEMQALSMRKIEELTLYIVELQKQLNAMKTKIEHLENK